MGHLSDQRLSSPEPNLCGHAWVERNLAAGHTHTDDPSPGRIAGKDVRHQD